MERIAKLCAVCVLLLASSAFMPQQKKKVIFFGDSITEAGAQPGGYITRVSDLATKENLASKYDFIGAGIGGNKVYDLYLRLEDDVLNKNPDVVIIYIGVNDVWHKRSSGTGTDFYKFGNFYNALIKKIQAKGARVILATPAVIGERTDFSNELDGDLNLYSNAIRDIAKTNNLPLIDLRKAFLEYNKQNNKDNKEQGILTSDRVHLNEKGNQLVAEEMWRAIKQLPQ
jgi:lysophospholipase L1-like esterase